jgi:hypothetical protein
MSNRQTIDQIDAAAHDAEAAIADLNKQFQDEQRQIHRQAFLAHRPLSPEEEQRLAEIGSAQKGLTNALIALSFVTLDKLDNSAEVQRLQSRMNRVNKRLTVDLDKLKSLERFSAAIAQVADTIARVGASLARLVGAVA